MILKIKKHSSLGTLENILIIINDTEIELGGVVT